MQILVDSVEDELDPIAFEAGLQSSNSKNLRLYMYISTNTESLAYAIAENQNSIMSYFVYTLNNIGLLKNRPINPFVSGYIYIH